MPGHAYKTASKGQHEGLRVPKKVFSAEAGAAAKKRRVMQNIAGGLNPVIKASVISLLHKHINSTPLEKDLAKISSTAPHLLPTKIVKQIVSQHNDALKRLGIKPLE